MSVIGDGEMARSWTSLTKMTSLAYKPQTSWGRIEILTLWVHHVERKHHWTPHKIFPRLTKYLATKKNQAHQQRSYPAKMFLIDLLFRRIYRQSIKTVIIHKYATTVGIVEPGLSKIDGLDGFSDLDKEVEHTHTHQSINFWPSWRTETVDWIWSKRNRRYSFSIKR